MIDRQTDRQTYTLQKENDREYYDRYCTENAGTM